MELAPPVTEPSQLAVLRVIAVSRIGKADANRSLGPGVSVTDQPVPAAQGAVRYCGCSCRCPGGPIRRLLLTAGRQCQAWLAEPPCGPSAAHGCVRVNGRGKRLPAETGGTDEQATKTAEIPAGSWTKWLVVGFWVAVVVVAFPLAGKLTGAEKNEAKCMAARERGVDQGRGPAGALPVTQHLPGGGGVPAGFGPDRGGPGQGGRRRQELREDRRGGRGPGDRADARRRTARPSRPSSRSTLASKAGPARAAADSIRAITSSSANGLASTSPARSGTRPTTARCSRASTAHCCTPPWRSSS